MPKRHSAFDPSILVTKPLAIKGLSVSTAILKPGEVTHKLETVHSFGVAPGHPTNTPAKLDGQPFKDVSWSPGSIGHLQPGVDLTAAIRVPSEASYVTIPDHLFRSAAFETIDVSGIEPRWTPDIVDPVIVGLVGSLTAAAQLGGIDEWPMLVESIGTALAVRAAQNLGAVPKRDEPYSGGLSKEKLQRVIAYIDANLHRPMTLTELASVSMLSTFHFARAFKAAMKIAPVRYVWRRRVECAHGRLRKSVEPLVMIAYECGFSSQSHFTTLFKEFFGVTPTAFRRALLALIPPGAGALVMDLIELAPALA